MTIVLCDNCGQRVDVPVRSRDDQEFCTNVCLIAKCGAAGWEPEKPVRLQRKAVA